MISRMIAVNDTEDTNDTETGGVNVGFDDFAIERRARRMCERNLSECRTGLLPLLFELSKLVTADDDLSRILNTLLRILERHMKIVRGMVNLFDPESGRIFIHESFGLSAEEATRGVYHLGEGVTGKVVETGQPIVVPRISK
ncbi:MAG: GAF domain-containing protein, partial [Azoarcus sp.]|nr:GAF domain-containing protein [Azoarcus sp.]